METEKTKRSALIHWHDRATATSSVAVSSFIFVYPDYQRIKIPAIGNEPAIWFCIDAGGFGAIGDWLGALRGTNTSVHYRLTLICSIKEHELHIIAK